MCKWCFDLVRIARYRVLIYSKNGLINASEVASRLGINASTVRKYLKSLEKEGLVERVDPGTYRLTQRGLSYVEFVKKLSLKREAPPYVVTDPSRGEPLQLKISSYEQLYAVIEYKLAPLEVIDEHIRKGFLAIWVRDGVGDQRLYELLTSGSISSSIELKKYLEDTIGLIKEIESSSMEEGTR